MSPDASPASPAVRSDGTSVEAELAARTDELARAWRELDALTYAVAHDLRAPLRGVLGYLDALREDHGAEIPAPALAYLQKAIDCAGRTQAMVDDLLKLSRLSRQDLVLVPTPLRRLVEDARLELTGVIGGRSIEWRIDDLPVTRCDAALVRQLLVHLLSNAVKFTRPRSHAVIAVQSAVIDGQTVVAVRDNGVGFDPNRAANLFTPFFRLHAPQDFEGTGVGLAFAAKIVRRHGGRIWTEATENQGASFLFTLGPDASG
jgi:light-regulated signal transduction histidine kinase (bacteriophytochrome)